jgi:hypothetical protein
VAIQRDSAKADDTRTHFHLTEPEDTNAADKLTEPRSRNLPRFLRPALDLATAWRESRFAKKSGRRALGRYRRLKATRPDLAGRALYEAFVCERNAIGPSAAQVILQRAESSFVSWSSERGLNFRYVVQYLVISEYLESNAKREGTVTNMADILARLIPERL